MQSESNLIAITLFSECTENAAKNKKGKQIVRVFLLPMPSITVSMLC
jgi:hypothetical protein